MLKHCGIQVQQDHLEVLPFDLGRLALYGLGVHRVHQSIYLAVIGPSVDVERSREPEGLGFAAGEFVWRVGHVVCLWGVIEPRSLVSGSV